jgi:2-polyprenyl-3-methyl-5-hydroxy-6-metoxy-1,4-benzoquinol methylase
MTRSKLSKDSHETLRAILEFYDESNIHLPAAPMELQAFASGAESIMKQVEADLGEIAHSDYFQCSRDRFKEIVKLAMLYLPARGRLLDIGNAPGYLALALSRHKFKIDGINLSDAWNAAYPSPDYLDLFNVTSCNIEHEALPYKDRTFDGIVFTEVLEHIAIRDPSLILPEFRRVLKPGGVLLFSTPNVCNLSNIIALARGLNIFWPIEMFYGGLDRHNREFTPAEVRQLFNGAGFRIMDFYGINDHANWRKGAADEVYAFLGSDPNGHALLRNTIIGAFSSQ